MWSLNIEWCKNEYEKLLLVAVQHSVSLLYIQCVVSASWPLSALWCHKNANEQNCYSGNLFHLISFCLASCLLCVMFFKFLLRSKWGQVVLSQIKNCHAEPLCNHNTMNDILLVCLSGPTTLLVHPFVEWSKGHGGVGGWGRWRVGSISLWAHSCVHKRCVPSVLNPSVCASLVPIVLMGQPDQPSALWSQRAVELRGKWRMLW